MLKARSLSIRQPWAWLIVRPDIAGVDRFRAVQRRVIKDIENRTWATRFRGGFLVHAAKGMTAQERESALRFAVTATHGNPAYGGEDLDCPKDIPRGGIVGYAEVIDCICTERHEDMKPPDRSPWFMGEFGFRLANVHPLPFLPLAGSLGFFNVEVPDDYIPSHLAERLAA